LVEDAAATLPDVIDVALLLYVVVLHTPLLSHDADTVAHVSSLHDMPCIPPKFVKSLESEIIKISLNSGEELGI